MPFATETQSLEQLRRLARSKPESAYSGLTDWILMARSHGDSGLIALGQYELARCLRLMNRLADAAEANNQACILAEAAADLQTLNHALTFHAMLMDDMGRPDEALALVERAMDIECPLDPREVASTKGVCGGLLCRLGRTDEGLLALRESMAVPGLRHTDRLHHHMALIWHLADDLRSPLEAAREWDILRAKTKEETRNDLGTAYVATELCIAASRPEGRLIKVVAQKLMRAHALQPHYATGWALMMALETFVDLKLYEEAEWVLSEFHQQAIELRKPDLLRWLQARQQLAYALGDEPQAGMLAEEVKRLQEDMQTKRPQDPRLLVMQLRNLEFRLSLASSRKDTERLRAEIRRRESELRHARALPTSLLRELFRLTEDRGADPELKDLRRFGFSLVYQPFYGLTDRRVLGAEVLLRLNHPKLGPLTPAEFIPRLDASGEIDAVGRWVISEACRQLHQWQARHPLKVLAVNVSAAQLAVSGLADHVAQQLRGHGLRANVLELEVTETLAAGETGTIVSELERLRTYGVGISIDDFGTGYSNFARLLDLQPSKIKIDRSLIHRLIVDPRSRQTVGALIQAAHSMGLSVTAEGIEVVEQLQILEQLGCDFVQGYLLSRPIDSVNMTKLLERSDTAPTCPLAFDSAADQRPGELKQALRAVASGQAAY